MSLAAISLPVVTASLAPPELREMESAAASFLQVLEDEMMRDAVPASLPPPTLPFPPSVPLPPDWLPVPLVLLLPREEKAAKKRPPVRKDRQPGRR